MLCSYNNKDGFADFWTHFPVLGAETWPVGAPRMHALFGASSGILGAAGAVLLSLPPGNAKLELQQAHRRLFFRIAVVLVQFMKSFASIFCIIEAIEANVSKALGNLRVI